MEDPAEQTRQEMSEPPHQISHDGSNRRSWVRRGAGLSLLVTLEGVGYTNGNTHGEVLTQIGSSSAGLHVRTINGMGAEISAPLYLQYAYAGHLQFRDIGFTQDASVALASLECCCNRMAKL